MGDKPWTDVYIYYGHGSDICYKSGALVITTVPKDACYVSKSACGIVTSNIGLDENLYIDVSGALVSPELPDHKNLLEKRFDSALEIHKPGDEIVESYFNSFGFYPNNKKGGENLFMIAVSGLRHYSTLNNYVKMNFGRKKYNRTDLVPKNIILESYEGAIFPDKETIHKIFVKDLYSFDDLKQISKNPELKIPVRTLLNRYKGIHYMLLCRNIHESCKEAAFKRRLYSAEKHGTNWNTLKRVLRFANDEQNIEKHMAVIKNKGIKIPKEEILNMYTKIPIDRQKYLDALGKNKNTTRKGCPPGQVRNAVTKKCREKRKPGPKAKEKL